MIWSDNGYDWKAVPELIQYGGAKGFSGLIYASGRFLAVTADRRFAHSVDGYNWIVHGEAVFPPGYPTSPAPRLAVAWGGHAYAAGPGVLRSPEFTTLLNPKDDPTKLLIYGRADSHHSIEALHDGDFTTGWLPLREVEIGPTGSASLDNWPPPQPGSQIVRARSLP